MKSNLALSLLFSETKFVCCVEKFHYQHIRCNPTAVVWSELESNLCGSRQPLHFPDWTWASRPVVFPPLSSLSSFFTAAVRPEIKPHGHWTMDTCYTSSRIVSNVHNWHIWCSSNLKIPNLIYFRHFLILNHMFQT